MSAPEGGALPRLSCGTWRLAGRSRTCPTAAERITTGHGVRSQGWEGMFPRTAVACSGRRMPTASSSNRRWGRGRRADAASRQAMGVRRRAVADSDLIVLLRRMAARTERYRRLDEPHAGRTHGVAPSDRPRRNGSGPVRTPTDRQPRPTAAATTIARLLLIIGKGMPRQPSEEVTSGEGSTRSGQSRRAVTSSSHKQASSQRTQPLVLGTPTGLMGPGPSIARVTSLAIDRSEAGRNPTRDPHLGEGARGELPSMAPWASPPAVPRSRSGQVSRAQAMLARLAISVSAENTATVHEGLAIAAGVGSGCCFAISSVLQQRGASRAPRDSGAWLFLHLLGRPIWLGGLLAAAGTVTLQAVAVGAGSWSWFSHSWCSGCCSRCR